MALNVCKLFSLSLNSLSTNLNLWPCQLENSAQLYHRSAGIGNRSLLHLREHSEEARR